MYYSNNSAKTYTYSNTFTNIDTLNINIKVSGYIKVLLTNFKVELTDNSANVGIKEVSNVISNLNVYPNPAINDFKVSFKSINEKALVKIYDISGNLVLENNEERQIGINVLELHTELAPGMYIVKVDKQISKLLITQ